METPSAPNSNVNIVFIGHVDAGKSTLSGQLLIQTGMVDQRTVEKIFDEAAEKKQNNQALSNILDTNEEERAHGKTVEVARAFFSTDHRNYTLLDAPGHRGYVPNMISGVSEADISVLVISARRGEFETGFLLGGQTKEHAVLAKVLGTQKIIVLVNKMDSVNWSKERYDSILEQLTPFLKSVGFSAKDISFLPMSGFTGDNLKQSVSKNICPWYEGKSFLETLDETTLTERDSSGPVRMPILDRMKENGKIYVMGKVESGSVKVGQMITMMPGKIVVEIAEIEIHDKLTLSAVSGDNVRMAIKGAEETDIIQTGFVLCTAPLVPVANKFVAQVMLLTLPEKKLFTRGYQCIIHLHHLTEEVSVSRLLAMIDKKTGEETKKEPTFGKSGDLLRVVFETTSSLCIEKFIDHPQLGRFTLRNEDQTIAVGKVVGLPK